MSSITHSNPALHRRSSQSPTRAAHHGHHLPSRLRSSFDDKPDHPSPPLVESPQSTDTVVPGAGCAQDAPEPPAQDSSSSPAPALHDVAEEHADNWLPDPQVVERPAAEQRNSSQKLAAVRAALAAANIISVHQDTDWETRPPGIDPRRVDIPDLKGRVVIQVADYAAHRAEFSVLTNDTLPDFLAQPRPEFAKVRWMHVNGLSWDVLKPLALHYDLHPLSLEDILHSSSSSSTRSKIDYFRQHLFCSVIVHRTLEQGTAKDVELPEDPTSVSRSTTKALGKGKAASKDRGGVRAFGFHHHRRDEEAIVDSVVPPSLVPSSQTSLGGHSLVPSQDGSGIATPLAVHAKSYSQYRRNLREAFKGVKRDKEGESPRTLSHNRTGLSTRLRGGKRSRQSKKEEERAAARWTVAALTKDVKVHIHVEQLSCFLLRDGTVLSVSQDQGYHHQISNLFERINMRDDILRESEDASFVLQALLDVTADDALEIVDEFREQLTTLESRVLSRPDMDDVRHLHILSSQLILLKSTLTPLQLLLQALRSQDDAKAAAAAKIDPSPAPTRSASPTGERANNVRVQRRGFVSHEARLYLSDVMDHMDSTLSSLDLFSDLAENLIAFTFNNLSYSSNAYMQALSVVSIVFIPATFLSSFYGMNFSTGAFVDELDLGVHRFWSIAIPVSVATTVLFGWGYLAEIINRFGRDILRMKHRIQIASRRSDSKDKAQ
ncbi:hypothetical protein JCM3775_006457 [Rhodotorula graminis]|uniref:Cora superfamily n=1 Tax=Rhodotorula graminis (strain WP1) TaxID=578459 RepID=A0A0P9EEI5_RHOGW|nr:uncharacterized protein RHOBADRAFT_56407 [Rhodotorula graminis WP1]KPV71791.1 hypothetical protein RHOBADRAFT_56407 [Rhodotorula graminis WP1]